MTTIETRVAGIPCQALVTEYFRQEPHRGSAWTCDSDMDFYGYEDICYEILDRRGRPAPWLERKLSSKDDDRIRSEISRWMSA